MISSPDPRLTLLRTDVPPKEGLPYRVISATADIREKPDLHILRGRHGSQLLRGETFIVHENKDGWCWGQALHDGYVGYIESRHLSDTSPAPTHIVTAARSLLYEAHTLRSQPAGTLGFGSRITTVETHGHYARLNTGEWIFERHIAPVDAIEKDYVATAQKFLETPYYWSGRSGLGIDCSGLVQISLGHAGISALRDTDMQQGSIGEAVPLSMASRPASLQRGDIVFFPAHVGIMVDPANIIHANAYHMKVTVEPLETVAQRSLDIEDAAIISVRRVQL